MVKFATQFLYLPGFTILIVVSLCHTLLCCTETNYIVNTVKSPAINDKTWNNDLLLFLFIKQ